MGSKGAAERRFLIFQTSARDALTLARHFAEQSEDRTPRHLFQNRWILSRCISADFSRPRLQHDL